MGNIYIYTIYIYIYMYIYIYIYIYIYHLLYITYDILPIDCLLIAYWLPLMHMFSHNGYGPGTHIHYGWTYVHEGQSIGNLFCLFCFIAVLWAARGHWCLRWSINSSTRATNGPLHICISIQLAESYLNREKNPSDGWDRNLKLRMLEEMCLFFAVLSPSIQM